MKPGDIIGWSGYSLQSSLINLFTWGVPLMDASHVGFLAEYRGRLVHVESTTDSEVPCIIQGKIAEGVQAVYLSDRLKTYNGRAWHYPLYRPLYDHESKRLTKWITDNVGKPYDRTEAPKSGGLLGLLTFAAHLARRQAWRSKRSRAEYFCSETDGAALSYIGIAPTDDPAKWNPNRLVRTLRKRGILLPPRRLK